MLIFLTLIFIFQQLARMGIMTLTFFPWIDKFTDLDVDIFQRIFISNEFRRWLF